MLTQPPHVNALLRQLVMAGQSGEVHLLESGYPLFSLLWELLVNGTPWWVREQPSFIAVQQFLGAVEEPLLQLIDAIEQESGSPYRNG